MSPGANLILPVPARRLHERVRRRAGHVVLGSRPSPAPRRSSGRSGRRSTRSSSTTSCAPAPSRTSTRPVATTTRASACSTSPTGLSSPAPIKQTTEVDDDVYWLKAEPEEAPDVPQEGDARRRSRAPSPSARTRRTSSRSTSSAGRPSRSPASRRTARSSPASGSPTTGSFDIGDGRTTFLADASDGLSTSPRSSLKVTKTGTYYVSIEAPDLPDPKDDLTARNKVDPQTTYTLKLQRKKSAEGEEEVQEEEVSPDARAARGYRTARGSRRPPRCGSPRRACAGRRARASSPSPR